MKNNSSDNKILKGSTIGMLASLIGIILFAGGIRLRLLDVPLERDEGEYAYAGQLILQGVAPYENVYNMKMPGIYAAYAVIESVFGQSHSGIHFGLLIINTATIVLIFFLGKELFGSAAGLISACVFAFLSLGRQVQGFSANAEHFVILPALFGILLLIWAVEKQKGLLLFVSGMLLGISFLMKQHGAAFIMFGGLYLLLKEFRYRPFYWKNFVGRIALFTAGVFLPFGLMCLILWHAGVFEKFWFWTFDYASTYASSVPFSTGLKIFKSNFLSIFVAAELLWIIAGIGLIFFWYKRTFRSRWLFVVGFGVFSFLAICPGFYFRPHYFILLLPSASLFAGMGAICIFEFFTKGRGPLLKGVLISLAAAVVLGCSIYKQYDYFFNMSPMQVSRIAYGPNPFIESLEIGKYLNEHSKDEDKIAVLGSEPQIYFYSKRRSATGHIYTYALMEEHQYALKMQEEMIREIESASPEYLILVNVDTSWLMRKKSERLIFKWFEQYSKSYNKVGMIDILRVDSTDYYWDEEAKDRSPKSRYWIGVFRRKSQSQKSAFEG